MDQFKGIPSGENVYESTEAHGGVEPTNPLVQLDPGLFVWTIITFLVLCFVLAKFAWKPLLLSLKEREDTIRDSLENAEKAKLELQKITSESEEIILKARSEAQEIHAEAKSAAEKVKSNLMAKAAVEAKKIKEDAEQQIRVEKDKAINEIRLEVVGLSMIVAEKVIKKNLSREDNQTLINETLKKLEGYDA